MVTATKVVSHSDMLLFLPIPDKKRFDPFGLKINELFKHPDLARYRLDDVRMNVILYVHLFTNSIQTV
jgi:hypothetical protein